MEYRTTRPAENGYANEDEQLFATRSSIQQTMYTSGPDELLDDLLVVANVCEHRALLLSGHPTLGTWYLLLGAMLRSTLELSTRPTGPRPDASLENPALYFPDVEMTH
jgi:hypothetical protein